jgi:DNA-binding beta-propeller fold protein YncE
VRWSNLKPKQATAVVTGFQTHRAADPLHQTGPLALWFLDPGLLVVGTSRDRGGDLVRAYELPEDDSVLSAEVARDATAPRDEQDGATCFAMTRSRANEFVPDMLVLAIRGANGPGRLMKARVQAGIVGEPRPFGAADAADSPRAVTVSNSGRILVGDTSGRLTFYNPIDGKVELALATDLKQLSGLAYSPTSGSLYAADFAGGIHRIDDASEPGHPACRTVKIADVSQPTALAFTPDGSLYVVTFGSGKSNGTLQVINGDL